MSNKITVTMSWGRLAAMDDNGMALYATPGAAQPYWASQPSFMYDECAATVHDFKTEYGEKYERDPESFEEDENFSAKVELLDPRE